MAIDFSQVKTITIPEGSVTKITDSTGNILWKAQTAEWHTVWSGIQKIGYGGWTGSEYLFATEPYSDTLQIRVTFGVLNTWKNSGDEGYSNYAPGDRQSPVTYVNASINVSEKTLVMASMNNTTRNARYSAVLSYNKKNGKIYAHTSGNSGEYARAYIVITKIEVYS